MINIENMIVASLDVDSQKGFTQLCPNELPVEGGHLIVDELNANAKLANFRIGTKDAHPVNPIWLASDELPVLSPLNKPDADVRWPRHCVPGTAGFESLPGLPHPRDYDFFVWKGIEPDMHPYGACYHDLKESLSTGLIEYLKSQRVEAVIVGGLAIEFCIQHTVKQLLAAGFKVLVNQAACAGLADDTSTQTYEILAKQGAIIVKNAQSLVR